MHGGEVAGEVAEDRQTESRFPEGLPNLETVLKVNILVPFQTI